METESIAVSYGPDSAELTLNAEINEPLALALESALRSLFRYYQYPAVLLRINSNGGELVALHHILKSLESWRAAGCQIRTEASFRAGSAAAVLLSLGEVGSRRVQGHTLLLYHFGRIVAGPHNITADGADQLAAMLQNADRQMVVQLAAHIQRGLGNVAGLAAEGRARCALIGLYPKSFSDHRAGRASKAANKSLRSITAMYTACHASASSAPFLKALIKRFEEDSRMDPAEAYALCLIDGVSDRPALRARASAVNEFTNDGKPLKLAA